MMEEKDRGEPIAIEIATEVPPAAAATRVPRRIRERLLPESSNNKTVPSVQDIEEKLLHAHLRRQVCVCVLKPKVFFDFYI